MSAMSKVTAESATKDNFKLNRAIKTLCFRFDILLKCTVELSSFYISIFLFKKSRIG